MTGALRLAQLVREPRRRMLEVERQVGAARLQDPEQTDDHVDRSVGAETDDAVGADAGATQTVRKLVGAGVELA